MTARVLAAALVALLAAPAAAFVRTRDRTTGEALFWAIPAVPWYLNRDWPDAVTSPSCRATAPGGDAALAAVRSSFEAWEQSCSSLRLVEGGFVDEIRTGLAGTSENENIVVFRRGWCSQHPQAKNDPCKSDPAADCGGIYRCYDDNCPPDAADCADWSIVALTSVLYEPDTGRIMDADIELNGWDGNGTGTSVGGGRPRRGWYFTCQDALPATQCSSYGEDACFFMDLRNTLTHEAGHFIGLAHPPSPAAATMFATTGPGEIIKRSLHADDVDGVCAIYPRDDGDGGCDCGSGGAGGVLALLVAAIALRRTRRG